jgi:5-methylcytosine-specific restriction endonuclease McrA
MAPRPCLVCGTLTMHSRCARHRLREPQSQSAGLGSVHRKLKKTTIQRWVRTNGWVCPGWQRPAHEVPPGGLTGDHIISRKVRPDLAANPENYGVLCQRCNSKKSTS